MAIQQDGWSIVAQYRKCGKTGCKVCAEGRGHGPYYYGTKTVDGRRVSRYFGKDAPGEDAQGGTQEAVVALRVELDTLRSENTRLHALVEELRGQLANQRASGLIGVEEDTEVTDTNGASMESTQDGDVHGLTANQKAVLSALKQECEGDRWVTALSLGRRMEYASSRTLPVLRRLAALGYAEEIERNKFKPILKNATPGSSRAYLVVDDTQELTRFQVEDIWRQETVGIEVDQDVLTEAHESFLRGLFRNTQDEHTRIRVGKDPRPYVCPFRTSGRGAHRTFGDPIRLVRTVVPWLIQTTAHQMERRKTARKRVKDQQMELRQSFERMPTEQLQDLHARMRISLSEGTNRGWTLTMAELNEREGLIAQVLAARQAE